ncbi:MAG: 3-methyl-2-oxobutanoate hydroxymethyltransferase [Desulfovibrio sp.]|uniref:3-methyl-2-oxobutanoate hydroxymethyltransferase n=1 Tax=Desulfovibrio sp. TaxID=885 RepID=UPI00258F01B8|nr:3-methyl-2-oxobutanoate hydroxymethyltransferase [Desulfovibrio sp.]MCD7982683.1 3-methyl-2-oxobutanoate hydroxymethyltransferase [Desulfovibrio sp.]
MKNTVATFRQAKGKEKLTMLTAYDYSIARLMDQTGINSLLVGDSLGMVMLGYPDTLPVTLEDMIRHCAAVARGAQSALVVCDMPFMSCQVSVADTVRNAGRLVKEGRAQAVKLEGGADFCDEVRALVRASIPVMGHLGLTPQSVNALGGYKVQGKSLAAAQKLLDDARAVQDAGAFSLVLECVPAALAARITRELELPVIGIGAGPDCDGQVLVWQDMLGLSDGGTPKFVKRFGAVGEAARAAFTAYAREVKQGSYPAQEHCYGMEDEAELLEKLY